MLSDYKTCKCLSRMKVILCQATTKVHTFKIKHHNLFNKATCPLISTKIMEWGLVKEASAIVTSKI